MAVIRVLLADDDAAVRASYRSILESDPLVRPLATEASTGRQAISMTIQLDPDVVLMDIRMPDLDGLGALEEIRQVRPDQAVIIVTTFGDDEYIQRAVALGANGFLVKSGDPHDLVRAVKATATGGAALSPTVAAHIMKSLRVDASKGASRRDSTQLTARERDVLALLARGLSNAEIAAELYIVEGTVKGYISTIFARLGVRNRVEAAIFAHRVGLT